MKKDNLFELKLLIYGISLAALFFHFAYYCFDSSSHLFDQPIIGAILIRLLLTFIKSGFFDHPYHTKLIALFFLAIGLVLGIKNNSGTFNKWKCFILLPVGAFLYIYGQTVTQFFEPDKVFGVSYLVVTAVGLVMTAIAIDNFLSLFSGMWSRDIFNKENETFPQQERKLTNSFSINLRGRYRLRNQRRRSWINIINPFRGTAIYGSPGAGKSHFIIRQSISQSLEKGMALFVYDFKFDDLSRLTYNNFLFYRDNFPVRPEFYVLDFDHLSYTSRCNPLAPSMMTDLSDAAEASRTILLALNRDWIQRQGDFFIESAVSFVTAAMWFLCKYENGRYCTLPHLIEFIQMDYAKLFSVLRSIPEVETMISSFVSMYQSGSMETLDSQVASARIALSGLASPRIYYVLSGNEFSLDINNPASPKIVCMGSNAQKQQLYGAVLSLYITRMIKQINKKGQHPCHIILDELSTTYINGLSNLLATARSNKVAVTFTAQSISLLRDAYGRQQADVLFSLPGNIFCGQANSDTAEAMSKCIGKNVQTARSVSESDRDSSYSQSERLGTAVPPSTITGLSAGEFVGYVADDPQQKISKKAFHCEIQADHDAIRKEESRYKDLPEVRQDLTQEELDKHFEMIQLEVQKMVADRLDTMKQSPLLVNKIIIKPNRGQNPKNRLDP